MGVTATPLIMAWQGYSGLPERREVTDEAEAEAVLDYLDGGHHGPVLVEVFDTSGHGPLLTVAAGASDLLLPIRRRSIRRTTSARAEEHQRASPSPTEVRSPSSHQTA